MPTDFQRHFHRQQPDDVIVLQRVGKDKKSSRGDYRGRHEVGNLWYLKYLVKQVKFLTSKEEKPGNIF